MSRGKITLEEWLSLIGAQLAITGAMYSPTNSFINVSIEEYSGKYRVLKLVAGGADFGRSGGSDAEVPNIYEAVIDLLARYAGKEVTFGDDHVFVVPAALDTSGLAAQL